MIIILVSEWDGMGCGVCGVVPVNLDFIFYNFR